MINPYEIMNLSYNSSLKDLTKSYYQLALLCHPDKGGTEEDMIVIHNAYKYIKEQLENCDSDKTYDDLEDEFQLFCKNQEEAPPPFRDIWEISDEKKKRDEFNKQFEELHSDIYDVFDNSDSNIGYQKYMVYSKYRKSGYVDNIEYKPLKLDELSNDFIDVHGKFIEQTEFENKMIEYKEPKGILERDKYTENDYYNVFSNPIKLDTSNIKERTLEEIIEEREKLQSNTKNLNNINLNNINLNNKLDEEVITKQDDC